MKKQQRQNGGPVTLSQLKEVLKKSFSVFEKKIDKKMDTRFSQVDKRLEQMDKQLEQVDKRLEQVDKRLERVDKQLEQVDKRLEQVDKQLEQVDTRFEGVDNHFRVMGGWFQAAQSIHALYTDKAINASEERITKKLDNIMSVIDGFLKRTEGNELEITFLGRQHDDLAKYCTEKIAYPVYGRKL